MFRPISWALANKEKYKFMPRNVAELGILKLVEQKWAHFLRIQIVLVPGDDIVRYGKTYAGHSLVYIISKIADKEEVCFVI